MRTGIAGAARLFLCALAVFALGPSGEARPQRFRGNREARPYTRGLPPVDRVELLELRPTEMWFDAVLASKTLEGAEARKVASLWRTQNYRPSAAMCHRPHFAVRFYSKDKLLTYATLCWECDNMVFIKPDLKERQAFVGNSKKGQALLRVFLDAFPRTS